MGQFDGRVVIVTGSSNGIGRATARLFAREGAMLTICGRDEKALNQYGEGKCGDQSVKSFEIGVFGWSQISRLGKDGRVVRGGNGKGGNKDSRSIVLAVNGNAENKVVVVSGDIREEGVMKRTIDETLQKFGRLDVLVNNAGGAATGATEGSELDGDLSNYDYAMDLNTKSVLRLCQLAFPHLTKTKGEIVNVSSIAGRDNGAAVGFPFYSVAKAAQDQLTRNLALHYISKGVRVNSVSPGAVSTNIMQKHGFTDEMVKRCEQELIAEPSRIPYQCIGKSEDIAEAILFLADRKRSNYIVGHQLVIDGGASLQMSLIADSPKIFGVVVAEAMAKK